MTKLVDVVLFYNIVIGSVDCSMPSGIGTGRQRTRHAEFLRMQLLLNRNINSTVYRDQARLGPLNAFWEEAFGDVTEPAMLEDNALPHKKICIPAPKDLGMICHQHPPNSPDLNPIEKHLSGY